MSQITSPSISRPIADTDEAETFQESDVTLSQSRTTVNSGEVQLSQNAQPVRTLFDKSGNKEPTDSYTTLVSGEVTLSENTSISYDITAEPIASDDPTGTARLRDTTRGVTIAKGDYKVTSVPTPARLQQTESIISGSQTTVNLAFQVKNAEANYDAQLIKNKRPQSGTAVVEWPEPTDVFRWDAVTFQRQGDVTVDIQHNDGSGWTTAKTNVDPGEEIEARPTDRVRFRVQLQKVDTGTSALESIYRRWIVGPTE